MDSCLSYYTFIFHFETLIMLKNLLGISRKFEPKEEIILRDYLAMERTKLANERTLLSYIRASLYLLIGGIALLQLEGFDHLKIIGKLALGFAVILFIIGIFRFLKLNRNLKNYYKIMMQQREREQK